MDSVPDIFLTMSYGRIEESFSSIEEWSKSKKFGPYINGELVKPAAENAGDKIQDPFHVRASTNADLERALASSLVASREWKKTISNVNYLIKIANLVERHGSLLGQAESLTRNVQLKDPREFDVPALVRWLKYYQGWVALSTTELCNWKPYGVVAAITGSNSPLAALAWLVVPALAAGNTVCLVVPPEDALPALLLAHICTEAGLPPGVLNVLPGGQEVISHLVSHQDIVKVASYGPTEFVREIKKKMADFPLKKLSMIMTGKTPMLVFDTADLDSAVECVVQSGWYNQGSVPWSVRTLLVQEAVLKPLVRKLEARLITLRVGTAVDKMADMGQPYDKQTIEAVTRAVEEAKRNNIQVLDTEYSDTFLRPTVFIGGDGTSNLVIDNDVVLPVITVIPFRTAKEAVLLANNSRYGFAASIWSSDTTVALEVADKLQMGTVWINSHGVLDPAVAIEGWKISGGNSFGGKSGFLDNLEVSNAVHGTSFPVRQSAQPNDPHSPFAAPNTEPPKRAYKLYYGGAYKNADGNAIQTLYQDGKAFATIADANRKDVRNAVEAALQAQTGWSSATAAHRAQVLYNAAANLSASSQQLISHLLLLQDSKDGSNAVDATKLAVTAALHRLNFWAAVCDKPTLPQAVRDLPNMTVTTTREPLGVVGIGVYGLENQVRLFDELIWPAIGYGNCVVLVVDSPKPTPCLELFKAIASALPAGVVNVLTGNSGVLTTVAEHQNVNGVFHFQLPVELARPVQLATLHNMKRIVNIDGIDFGMNGVESSPIIREVYELAMTRSKAIWINKGEMFAN